MTSMDQSEAKLFFTIQEGEPLKDAYDRILFEHKQFFLSKTPIRKVFEGRVDKMEKQLVAYNALGGLQDVSKPIEIETTWQFSDHVKEAFNQYQTYLSRHKQLIMSSKSFENLIKVH